MANYLLFRLFSSLHHEKNPHFLDPRVISHQSTHHVRILIFALSKVVMVGNCITTWWGALMCSTSDWWTLKPRKIGRPWVAPKGARGHRSGWHHAWQIHGLFWGQFTRARTELLRAGLFWGTAITDCIRITTGYFFRSIRSGRGSIALTWSLEAANGLF